MKLPRGHKPATPFTRPVMGGFAGVNLGGTRAIIPQDVDAPGSSDGDGGALSTCKRFLGSLRPGNCFTVTLRDSHGNCACVDLTQTAKLEWPASATSAASTTSIHGCPPGVVTTLCPDGGPKKFAVTVAGFTGGSVGFNQTYTLTYTSGETWTQVKNGVTVTQTKTDTDSWTLTLTDGTNTITYAVTGVVSCCVDLTFELDDAGGAEDPPATLTSRVATTCGLGVAWRIYLDRCKPQCSGEIPRLRLIEASSSASNSGSGGSSGREIVLTPMQCGVDSNGRPYAEWYTDDATFCTDTAAKSCEENSITFRVTCKACSLCDCAETIEWTAPGWYCVCGNGCEFFDTDPGPAVLLGFGPFDTQTACESYISVPCECDDAPVTLPRRFCVSIALTAGVDCACLDGAKRLLTYDPIYTDTITSVGGGSWWVNSARGQACGTSARVAEYAGEWVTYEWRLNVDSFAPLTECQAFFELFYDTGPSTAPCGTRLMILDLCGTLAAGDPAVLTWSPQDCLAFRPFCPGTLLGPEQPTYEITITPVADDAAADACADDPPPATWNCLEDTGDCVDPGDGTGEFATLADCLAHCSTPGQWFCVNVTSVTAPGGGTPGNCFNGGGTGAFCVQAYNATDGTGFPGFTGGVAGGSGTISCGGGIITYYDIVSGPHETEAECAAVCEADGPCEVTDAICCPEAVGGLAQLDIVGGANEGHYEATWECVLSGGEATLSATFEAVTGQFIVTCAPGTFPGSWGIAYHAYIGGGSDAAGSLSHSCVGGLPVVSFPAYIAGVGTTSVDIS